jgi:vitamin B12 transporter
MIKVTATSTIYANFSSGYNAPSLYQLHSPDQDPTSQISRGNVNLRPETSETNEFGVYQKINDRTGVRIGYFSTLTSDVIEYVYLWDKNIKITDLGNDPNRNDYR